MASKLVTDRGKGAAAVAAITEGQGGELVSRLQGAFAPRQGLQVPDWQALLPVLGDHLRQAQERMSASDTAHEDELADDPAERDARDTQAEAVRGQLVRLRDLIRGVYGGQVERSVFSGPAPRDTARLRKYGEEVAGRLTSLGSPPPVVAGASLDTASLGATLGEDIARLGSALDAVTLEERQSQATLARKNEAIDAYDRAFQGVSTLFTGLFILAGQDDLADRVRPSLRRPGRPASLDDEASSEESPTTSPAT